MTEPEPLTRDYAEFVQRLLGKALTIRRTEETLLSLFSQGRLSGTVHTCIGQEWVGIALAEFLRPGDSIFSNHRCHGHYIAWTDDVEGLIAEVMGRTTGVCGGRGGSQHLCRDGFFSNGIQGGMMPVAAGVAMARQIRGEQSIAAVLIGDGTLGEGVVYETLNLAGCWDLPLLVVLEDNGIAQSTHQPETLAGTIAARAEAFGIGLAEATTDHPEELLAVTAEVVRHVRTERRPFFLHVRTRRLMPHSKGDDTRDPQVLADLAAADPLNHVLASPSEQIRELLVEIDRRIEQAVEQAAAADLTTAATSPTPREEPRAAGFSPADLSKTESSPDYFRQLDQHLQVSGVRWTQASFPARRVIDAMRVAFAAAMERDQSIVLLGEDIRDPYGGAFKATAGLSSRFGSHVRNTPISEAGIVGLGNGLALAGLRPVVEIMFGDFITLTFDQLVNHAAKFAWMYNDAVEVPVVIRTPMGGHRGYGPTHSQSLEKHLLGVPGLRVLALTHRYCPELLYAELLKSNRQPTLVVENKLLYATRTDSTAPQGGTLTVSDGPFPTVRVRSADDCQVTIVAYGGMVPLAESAIEQLAEREDLCCDLLIPTQLYPFDIRPVIESVRQTGRLLVVEEGQGFAGLGSELIAQVASHPLAPAGIRCARVFAADCPIPAAKTAEQAVLPGAAHIFDAVRELILQP